MPHLVSKPLDVLSEAKWFQEIVVLPLEISCRTPDFTPMLSIGSIRTDCLRGNVKMA
jgi:hypothetical protein